jgi:UDP-2,3-diacylglucosamine hydrolase
MSKPATAPPIDPAPPLPTRVASIERLALQAPMFVSDLHLDSTRPRTVERFLGLLGRIDRQGGELLILGDLFEVWPGDDSLEQDPTHARIGRDIAWALRDLAAHGTQVFLMHGNRDLLLGEGFLRASGARLLADPCLALSVGTSAPAVPILLSHGDAYCTLDLPYQTFRRQARDAQFQAAFLARPLPERRVMLGQARQRSEAGKRETAESIMDVTPEAIDTAMRAAGVRVMIHGHTHRPARHEFLLDGQPAVRWVLPDWQEDDTEPLRGGGLHWTNGQLQTFSA